MSTFNGQVLEFPDIRVDFFRHAPNARPPLACFLSHVHSDHLAGLESLKAPFVYCSAATREILLRLERFPHRVNFQLGILQSRAQHYRHLKNLLKPLPLETPTRIELSPGKEIQVTLFDANHCTGSVMFLIEGDGKAILYTGDIRCEPWFVNGLRRNPILMEYTSGIKKLDCVYLDTTFTDDIHFPTKAEGLVELLKKIRKYPSDTVFHFTAWTFGYEEVWVALSKALKSPIHVDQYKLSLYEALCPKLGKSESTVNPAYLAAEAPALIGHHYGNNYQKGCLTLDPTVRIHSCEKGMRCPALTRNTVFIQPILARGTNGVELLELGAGGGQGDLTQKVELEIDSDAFVQRISDFFKNASKEVIDDMKSELTKKLEAGRNTVKLEDLGIENNADEMSLEELVKAALTAVPRQTSQRSQMEPILVADEELSRLITFPYSRHASYKELCDLVTAFYPADVYPCTVDERKWFDGVTMKGLFGQCCDESVLFRHDGEMEARHGRPIAGATQTQHASQASLALDEPLSRGIAVRVPQSASMSHKRKAEDNPPSTDKRVREFSPISDGSMDLDASHVSIDVDKSDDDWETDDAESHDLAFWMYENDEEANNIWDPIDKVWRCKECGWEKWYRFRDCKCEGDFGVTVVEDREMSREGLQTMHTIDENGTKVDIDLMDSPSNYDSVSDAANDEFEADSFIDDSSMSVDETSDKDSDYELDDREKYMKSLAQRDSWNRLTILSGDNFTEHKQMIMASDYESDDDEFAYMNEEVRKDGDSDSEAQAEDPDYRYLWQKMKVKEDDALGRLVAVDMRFEEWRRTMPDYVSEEDPWNSAYESDFDLDFDMPRSQPNNSAEENEVRRRKWAKECEKFSRLYTKLLATKKTFRELREAVLGKGNDNYRDYAEKDHVAIMAGMNVEPHPYGTNRPKGLFGDEKSGYHWEQLFRRAHMRVHGIQDLLRDGRKEFKAWRRSHKEDYISYEDPYDSEYPTTIADDNAEPQYLDEDIESLQSDFDSLWWHRYNPHIPEFASDGLYRRVWSQCCRAFSHITKELAQQKKAFKHYREMALEFGEIDSYIDLNIKEHADKLFSSENEPRPFGEGKLGRYGNDERGWDWKGLAEKGRARLLQMRRVLEQDDAAFTNWRINHALECESDCDSLYADLGEDRYEFSDFGSDEFSGDDDVAIDPVFAAILRMHEEDKQALANGEQRAVWMPKTAKQTRVTDYFSESENLPWHLLVQKKAGPAASLPKETIQTRITDYIAGKKHLLSPWEQVWGRKGYKLKKPPAAKSKPAEQAPFKKPYTIKHIGQIEKQQISTGITQLKGKPMETAIIYLRKDFPNLNLEDPEFDVDTLSRETLSRLHDLIQQHCSVSGLDARGDESTRTQDAAERVLNDVQNGEWRQVGLISVDNNHQEEELEL